MLLGTAGGQKIHITRMKNRLTFLPAISCGLEWRVVYYRQQFNIRVCSTGTEVRLRLMSAGLQYLGDSAREVQSPILEVKRGIR